MFRAIDLVDRQHDRLLLESQQVDQILIGGGDTHSPVDDHHNHVGLFQTRLGVLDDGPPQRIGLAGEIPARVDDLEGPPVPFQREAGWNESPPKRTFCPSISVM